MVQGTFRFWVGLAAAFALIVGEGGAGAQEYLLGEGDLLSITVYENEDLSSLARVDGEGAITFPLVGEVKVGGHSVREAAAMLTALLSDGYIVEPHLSVLVQEYRSKKVTILGEVNKPGLYELSGEVTLLELISMAEGLTEFAGGKALIKHSDTGDKGGPGGEYISVNLKDLTENGDLSANLQVMDKDSVFISRSGLVYVTGEVNKPGAYRVEEGTTVLKAIALAGGLTDKAAPKRAVLIRKDGDGERTVRAEMNSEIVPDDLISIPESFF